jgi:hypothetical protein
MTLPEYIKRTQKKYSQTEKGRLVRERYYEKNKEKIINRVLNRYREKINEKIRFQFFEKFKNFFD